MATLLFPSCSSPRHPKIGLLVHSFENERWEKDKTYLENEITRLGGKVFFELAGNNQAIQIDQAKKMIDQGAKVLIVIPIKQSEAAKIVEMAHQYGVKVIAYDRMINNCDLDYYVSANSISIGEMQASCLTSIKPKGEYALICGSRYDNNSMRLFIGQMNVLEPLMEKGDVKVVSSEFTEDWTPEEGYRHTLQLLDKYGETLTGIIAGSDALAGGVIQALKDRGKEGKIMVAGQDAELQALKAIVWGYQTCTVLKPLKEMATQAAKLAVDLASGENVAPTDIRESNGKILVPSILLNSILVTKDNLEQTVIASGYHTKDEIYH